MFKRELYIKKIRPYIDKPFIKVLTGIRRSGKSVILKLLKTPLQQRAFLLLIIFCSFYHPFSEYFYYFIFVFMYSFAIISMLSTLFLVNSSSKLYLFKISNI